MRWHDYDIRVYEDGDVSVSCFGEMEYATMLGTYGIQCNADDDTEGYVRILEAARSAGGAMVALDKAIGYPNDVPTPSH